MPSIEQAFLSAFQWCEIQFSDSQPYPWASGDQLLDDQIADEAAAELRTLTRWERVTTHFYTHEIIPISRISAGLVPDTVRSIVRAAASPRVAAAVSRLVAQPVRLVTVDAHRMWEGDHIAVHNDANSFGELLRLTWFIGQAPSEGGGFVVHTEMDEGRVHQVVPFQPNRWISFSISMDSYHSVPPMRGVDAGGRNSMIFTWGTPREDLLPLTNW